MDDPGPIQAPRLSAPREADALARERAHLEAAARHLATGGVAPAPSLRSRHPWLTRLGPLGFLLVFVLGKLKLLLPLLKMAKLGTLVTMIASVWVYTQLWGFAYAAGFVLLIFVHELGHLLVMRQQGIPAGAPVFIPFVGAVIAMRGLPRDAWVEALVGIGGPVLGSLGALACLGWGLATGSTLAYALAQTGFMLNLFNLMPISPLDGGRIVGVISRWLWVAGYAICILALIATWNPILLLILIFGLSGLARALRGAHPDYFAVPARRRLAMAVAYFGLLGLLALAMVVSGRPLGFGVAPVG